MPRGYCRYYPDDAHGFAPLSEVREALDPKAGGAPAHRYLDNLAQAIRWQAIDRWRCQPALSHALALDRQAGPARLKAIVSRAYEAGDAFADAMAQDLDDEAFARWATTRPRPVKGATLATFLDGLVGGGIGIGGSEYRPNHVRIFSKYCDGGLPWEPFKLDHGLLQRALGVIDRDVSADTLDIPDLFNRVTEAIRCLDEVRDLLSGKSLPQRFRFGAVGHHQRTDPIRAAIGAFAQKRQALGWEGSPLELHSLVRGSAGVPADIEDFQDALDEIGDRDQALAHYFGTAFLARHDEQKRIEHVQIAWNIHSDVQRAIVGRAKRTDLPRFFFVARLAEMFAVSTGEVPTFANIKAQGRFESTDERWINLFDAALDVTALGGARPGLLDRLAGRRDHALEGAGNASRLEALPRIFVERSHKIGWSDGFLTDWMVAFTQRFPVPP